MATLNDLHTKIFADGADFDGMIELRKNPLVKGFTTNPTLMRQSGITDYSAFAHQVLAEIKDLPVSFEVFADDLKSMERQARILAGWGGNVNVKIPVTTTSGEFTGPILSSLSQDGIVLNVTAIMTVEQTQAVADALSADTPAIVSVFAGRVADTGRDPMPHMKACLSALSDRPKAELLWASPRELLNIFQASAIGCPIITVGHDLLAKLSLVGKDLTEYSRETVAMFHRDATASGFQV